jgi:MFS family permease
MYMYLSLVTEFVQTPSGAGYGFGASVVVAGLCLVPFSILSLSSARLLPWLGRTIGERAILPIGCLVVAAAGVFFALEHRALWEAFVTMSIVGVGMGTTFAAIPGMVVRSVPDSETGSAMGFYQVVRYVGFSLGSALAASILAAHTPAGAHLPAVGGYTTAMWIAIGICVVAGALAWFLPEHGARRAAARLGEEDAELASAGLVGIERP